MPVFFTLLECQAMVCIGRYVVPTRYPTPEVGNPNVQVQVTKLLMFELELPAKLMHSSPSIWVQGGWYKRTGRHGRLYPSYRISLRSQRLVHRFLGSRAGKWLKDLHRFAKSLGERAWGSASPCFSHDWGVDADNNTAATMLDAAWPYQVRWGAETGAVGIPAVGSHAVGLWQPLLLLLLHWAHHQSPGGKAGSGDERINGHQWPMYSTFGLLEHLSHTIHTID